MTTLPVLDPVEQRVLGSLMEKQVTVPSTYPLTMAALRTACNQTSNRDPVVEYDESALQAALRPLRDRALVRVVWADHGRRTLKYHQLLTEQLALSEQQAALLTVLLLRGAQAPGELRTRTERMAEFADRHEVEQVLAAMAAQDPALVRQLRRQQGQRDRRWVHLLGAGPIEPDDAAQEAARPTALRDGPVARDERVRATYGMVAADYAEAHGEVLEGLPFERWVLDRAAAAAIAVDGPVVEVGCGPGMVTAYLSAAGADATGIDLTPEMVTQARSRFPELHFEQGDLRQLMRPPAAVGWAAVVAWYSLIHFETDELDEALAALVPPLARHGVLLIAAHVDADPLHVTEWFGHEVDLDFVRFDPADLLDRVRAAGLTDVEWYLRGRRETERSDRIFVLARRPR